LIQIPIYRTYDNVSISLLQEENLQKSAKNSDTDEDFKDFSCKVTPAWYDAAQIV